MIQELTEKEKKIASNIGCEVKMLSGEVGINLGLYFPQCWTERGRVEANGVNVYFPEKKKVYVQNYNQVKLIIND